MNTVQKVCLLLCGTELWSSPTRLMYFKRWGNAYEHRQQSFEARISLIASSGPTKGWDADRQSNKLNVERNKAANVQLEITSGSKSRGLPCVISLLFMQTVTTSATNPLKPDLRFSYNQCFQMCICHSSYALLTWPLGRMFSMILFKYTVIISSRNDLNVHTEQQQIK